MQMFSLIQYTVISRSKQCHIKCFICQIMTRSLVYPNNPPSMTADQRMLVQTSLKFSQNLTIICHFEVYKYTIEEYSSRINSLRKEVHYSLWRVSKH